MIHRLGGNQYNWQFALDDMLGRTFPRRLANPIAPGWGNLAQGSVFSCPSYERLSKISYPYGYNVGGVAGIGHENRWLGLGGMLTHPLRHLLFRFTR